jgi:hypothetical protein
MSPLRWLPVLALLAVAAGPQPVDPDWPCVQRLVPTLTAATLWAGHDPTGNWRSDPKVSAVVAEVAPRARPAQDGVARLRAFALAVPASDRPGTLATVFAGLVDETNAERGAVIANLRSVARRQRELTAIAERITAELRGLPATAAAAEREEVTARRVFVIRQYEEVERTIRYACEVPVQLEARLGLFAQTLQEALPD